MQGLQVQVTDGNLVIVPASLTYLSTYVLLEQEDWFEKELCFVRRYLRPGMRALDIGANYGLYSVAMGKAVGTAGRIWSFEPAHDTLRFLRNTLASNDLAHVAVEDCALSDQAGRGRLATQRDSELNSLVHGPAETGEDVRVDTLDAAAARGGMQGIDFVKLDAEGEEARIVTGGREFFRSEDPLVMFELKHGQSINTALLECLRAAHYRLFRLVGPSSLLVPLEDGAAFDSFELNLFACKAGRAAHLQQQGLLLTARPAPRGGEPGAGLAQLVRQPFAAAWPAQRPGAAPGLLAALDAYALWRRQESSAEQRYGALLWAFETLESEVQRDPSAELMSLLARVAQDAGGRMRAVQVIGAMLNVAMQDGLAPAGPVWPATAHYDSVAVTTDPATWLVAATAEAMILSSTFSGYFTGAASLRLLDWLHDSPYVSAPMERRRQLQQLQAKRAAWIEPSETLSRAGPAHRNAEFWRRAAAEHTTMPASLVRSVA